MNIKKIVIFCLTGLIILLSLKSMGGVKVQAANCTFTVSPETIYSNFRITITIVNSSDTDLSEPYWAILRDKTENRDLITLTDDDGRRDDGRLIFAMDSNSLSQEQRTHELVLKVGTSVGGTRCADENDMSEHRIYIIPVIGPPSGNSCKITLSPSTNITSETPVAYTVENFTGSAGNYDIHVVALEGYPETTTFGINLPGNNSYTSALGPGSHGVFYAKLTDTDYNLTDPPCVSQQFSIEELSDDGGLGPPGENPCPMTGYGVRSCKTALGWIPADITAFARRFLEIAIGIAGGIALILLVFGSIRVLTSSGNQQSLAAGRDVIIAAVAGLLFLIFSVLILRALGIVIGIQFL